MHLRQKFKLFYESLGDLHKNCKSQKINNILGEFNAKVGTGKQGKTVGPHGLGTRNKRGERLLDGVKTKIGDNEHMV